jgi:2-polyprenyl-3-methyl-5-hydroxy-6-metoxy-1,4-benzoquinol methylase
MSKNYSQVRDFFSGYAGKWDSLYGKKNRKDPFSIFADSVLRRVIKIRFVKTVEIIKENSCENVLDVGCGSGRYVLEFAREGLDVHGIDFAKPMLVIAEESLKALALSHRAKLQQLSWQDFDSDKKYDAVVAIGFFDYQEDPSAALEKMVKTSNKVVVASFPKSSGILAIQRRIRYRIRNCPLWMYSHSDIEDLVANLTSPVTHQILKLGRDYLLVLKIRE